MFYTWIWWQINTSKRPSNWSEETITIVDSNDCHEQMHKNYRNLMKSLRRNNG